MSAVSIPMPWRQFVLRVCMAVAATVYSSALYAQLNDTCVVSVLNRTVQVKPDGTWVLPNIPANFGPVRARATCVENGITRSGQSDFFTIPANGSIDVPPITLGPVTPIPTQVTIAANPTTLTQAGQTAQLQVTARYADGNGGTTPVDITSATTGTTYLVSNPNLATVSAGGLVTARASGTVLVQAQNEGTQGILQLTVALSSDSDGDGILDDIELREGLNPNNPADGFDDLDRDGLINRDELQRGTGLRNPDTDGDGIQDGEEVVAGTDGFITNPLLADSDGDGVPDRVEIASGSDPGNASSVNLAQALQRIVVAPQSFLINVNAIEGEGSTQLTVTGEFKLGGTIDLTARARGTLYSSNNLQVCNFGAEDGRVFGGENGSCTITVTNSGFQTVVTGVVRNFQPRALSQVAIPGYANNVDVAGSFAYVAAGSAGLQIVNVADPLAPQVVKGVGLSGNANDVRVVGNLAYIAVGTAGLQIVDVSTPASAAVVGSIDTPGEASDVIVYQTRAFIADGSSGLAIINISNPAAPTLVKQVDTPGYARGVDVLTGANGSLYAVVVDDFAAGLRVIDVTDPGNATQVGSIDIGGSSIDVRVRGAYAYVAAYTGGLQIVNLTNPLSPTLAGSLPTQFVPRDVEVAGNWAIFAEQLFPNAVPLVEISSPSSPILRTVIDFSRLGDYAGTGIAVSGPYLYMTGLVYVVGAENGAIGDTRLFIGQYLPPDEGSTPPQVTLTAPPSGSSVVRGMNLYLQAEATDDVGVVAVNFFVNGGLVGTDGSPPYEATYRVPANATNLTAGATAVDNAGLLALSNTASVTAIPDPLTTARGRVVLGTGVAAGATVKCGQATGTTGSDGVFTVPGLPTIAGDVICQATFVQSGNAFAGTSEPRSPVLGGTTVMGDVVLTTAVYDLRVDPKGTWLFRDTDPNGGGSVHLDQSGQPITIPDNDLPASRVTLQDLEVFLGVPTGPGTVLRLDATGSISFCGMGYCNPPWAEFPSAMFGRFVDAQGQTVPIQTEQFVQDYLVEFVTPPTCDRNLPTDIQGDFVLLNDLEYLASVPAGAVALEFSAWDCYFRNNDDPDGDFRVSIAPADDITTVIGRVVRDTDSQPVSGANVNCSAGTNIVSAADGSFVFRGHPVWEDASIYCEANIVEDGALLIGYSSWLGLTPVRKGTTVIGDIRIQQSAAPAAEFPVSATGTWLPIDPEDVAVPATRVTLQVLSNRLGLALQPGDILAMSVAGGMSFCVEFGCPDGQGYLVTRFVDSNGNTLAPVVGVDPVPNGWWPPPDWFTQNTCPNNVPTDGPGDFPVFQWAGFPTLVGIPAGAVAIEFTTDDCQRRDNADPNGDFRVWLRRFDAAAPQ